MATGFEIITGIHYIDNTQTTTKTITAPTGKRIASVSLYFVADSTGARIPFQVLRSQPNGGPPTWTGQEWIVEIVRPAEFGNLNLVAMCVDA